LYRRPAEITSSPGLSSRPANSPPIITHSAPAASALAMSPDWRMPPSAITGTPARCCVHARDAFITAVIWGTPTPVTTRVVQIEPGPMPTLTASAPASIRSIAPSRGRDVARDDLDVVPLLDLADGVDDVLAVPVRGVDDEHVRLGRDQRLDAVVLVRAHRRAAAEPPALVGAGVGNWRAARCRAS
jgi:hypothetical protein